MKTFDTVAKLKLAKLKEGQFVNTGGYYTKGEAGSAEYFIKTSAQATTDGDVIDGFGNHTLANGNVAILQIDGIINLFQYGLSPSQTKTVNNASFAAALARTDFDVVRVPFVDAPINVIGNLSITNGKRIIFDSEYMGEPLLADPDRGIIGDGTAPIFTTGFYPAVENTNRQCRMENARLRNTNFPCVEMLHSDDFYLDHCFMLTSDAEALKIRFSARVEINGGHYLTSFAVKELETNFAITAYDNCNGLVISPSTIIAGGANGGGVDVTQSQKINIDGIYEVCGGYGQRVGGFSGDPNALWTTATSYTKGDEVKDTVNGYVANVTHTSGATFAGDAANWDVINGNCNGVKFGGYFEQVQRPFSIGANNYCLGVTQGETFVNNSELPANGVPVPDFCIQLGAVVGFGYVGGVSYHKEGTEPTFDFIQPFTGGAFGDFLQDGTLEGHHIQGGGPDFVNNITASDNIGRVFGRSKIKLVRGGVTSGDRQVYISDTITGTVGTGQDAFILDTGNGGVIDKVTIIEKSGTITSTLRIGPTAATAEIVLIDPETLTYAGNAAAATILSDLIRPSTRMEIRVVAGAGTGTYRVKIEYRI